MAELMAHIQSSFGEPVAHAFWFRQSVSTTCEYSSYLVTVTSILITTSTFTNIWGVPTATATVTSLIVNSTMTTTSLCTAVTSTTSSTSSSSILPTSSTILPTSSSMLPTSSSATSTATVLSPVVLAAAGLALGLALGLGLGVAPAAQNAVNLNANLPAGELNVIVNGLSANLHGFIPENVVPFAYNGTDSGNDSCADAGARTPDGLCLPLLRSAYCPSFHWTTVDPDNLTAKCSPRLCGLGRVFLASDGLCHDVNDALECAGGRRLYYSAYGDPICDCPIGQFPFPDPGDPCAPLFARGPCPRGHVVSINSGGSLSCQPSPCPGHKAMVAAADGFCYELGTRGPCSTSQLLGFDVFDNRSRCVDVSDDQSPYFISTDERHQLDRRYNQIYVYDELSVLLNRGISRWFSRRQGLGFGSAGIFRLPTFVPDPLLAPCRPGARYGNNYKCTNPLIPNGRERGLRQAVRPGLSCRPREFLTAAAACRSSSEGAACGPSYEFNSFLRRCTQSRFSLE